MTIPPTARAPSTRLMMLRQFLRLYVSVIFPVILLLLAASWVSDEWVGKRGFIEQVRESTGHRYAWVLRQLQGLPQDQWAPSLEAARRFYPLGLQLTDEPYLLGTIEPTEAEAARFGNGEVAFAKMKNYPQTYAYQRVPDTHLVLGTRIAFSTSNTIGTYLWYLLFAIVAAAPILWFWFRPFWRDLERLSVVTEQIGSGDFSVQAQPVRSPQIKPFAEAIDHMGSAHP